jgi:hypothetical protein
VVWGWGGMTVAMVGWWRHAWHMGDRWATAQQQAGWALDLGGGRWVRVGLGWAGVHFLVVVFGRGMVVFWGRGGFVGVLLGAHSFGVLNMDIVVLLVLVVHIVGLGFARWGGQGDAHKGGQDGCEDEYFHFVLVVV